MTLSTPGGTPASSKSSARRAAPRGRALGGLEDEGVPRHQGERKHPERDHDREVEGGDAGDDTHREAVEVLVHARGRLAQRPALQERRRAAGKVDHLDAPAYLSTRLVERLAVVPGYQRRQLLEVLVEEGLVPEHQADPVCEGSGGPTRARRGGLLPTAASTSSPPR